MPNINWLGLMQQKTILDTSHCSKNNQAANSELNKTEPNKAIRSAKQRRNLDHFKGTVNYGNTPEISRDLHNTIFSTHTCKQKTIN